MRILLTICITASSLFSQTGKLAAPSSGFVYDPATNALRRIQGIPGAAIVGTPVDFGLPVSAAYVSPRLDSAFVLSGDGQAHFFRLTQDAPLERAVDSLGTPARVAFSPTGSAAALFSPGNLQVVKGLPDAPTVAANIRLRIISRPRRPLPETLAVSDDGAYVLYSAGGPLELIDVAGNSRNIINAGAGALAAFSPGSHNAAIAQAAKVVLFQDIAGAATEQTFDGVDSPSAVAFSADAQKLLVASAAGRSVTAIQTATGERSAYPCNCSPGSLVAMGSFFRLNEMGHEPLWLLDPSSERALFFVPAGN